MKIKSLSFCLLLPIIFFGINLPKFSQLNVGSRVLADSVNNLISPGLVFQSKDNGNTWQDISVGLSKNFQADRIIANDNELYLAGNSLYRSQWNMSGLSWKKENLLFSQNIFSASKEGIVAFNSDGQFLRKIYNTSLWMPIYQSFKGTGIRSSFETSYGTLFIGSDEGLFKSVDNGKTWNLVYKDGWGIKIVEADGVLLATNQHGILRSTDDGEHWNLVINEGGVGIDLAKIEKGFAAITYNTTSKRRRIRTSYDGGKTWNAIDAGLPAHDLISTIIQSGKYLLCGHPNGIYRSADSGKTWKLILPSISEKVFSLTNGGNVIYALARVGGC